MGKLIDLQGQIFGELTVIFRGPNTTDNKTQWYCKCSCGKELLITSKTLRNGATNCGCKKKTTLKDLTGQKFGRLTVLTREGSDKNKKATWNCICDCGKTVIIRGTDLTTGKIKSCGCLKTDILSQDLSGKTFGKLTVLKPTDKRIGNSIAWLCQCECGGEILVSTNHLTTGNTQSCGCLVSKGELKITNYLQEKKISYIKQYMFSDLFGKKRYPLRFDFAIFNDNKFLGLIEFQGIQHYENVYNLDEKDWEYSLKRDQMKRDYCMKNNIPLLEIKYLEDPIKKIEEWLSCVLLVL